MSNLIGRIVRRGREERQPLTAGGLTFTTVLSLVPLLVVSFALFTRVPALRSAGEGIREYRSYFPAERNVSMTLLHPAS